jgi:Holliday junction DNA helicase RuvA
MSLEERSLFRELIRVSGVGPKLALSILSGIPSSDLVDAISSKDTTRLHKIPGIGKKTADRLAVELSDRLSKIEIGSGGSIKSSSGDKVTELESVLINLGYQKSEILKAVESLKSRETDFSKLALEALVKETLGELTQVKQ